MLNVGRGLGDLALAPTSNVQNENDALHQDAAGKVTLQVRSDCSWAGMAFVPAG